VKKIFLFLIAFLMLLTSCKQEVQMKPAWKLTLKSRPYVEPIVRKDRFFAFSQVGEMVCGRVNDGTKIWTEMLGGPILGRPAWNDNQILVITQNGFLYSINSETGKQNWNVTIPDAFSAPVTVFASNILLPSESGKIHARSIQDGSAIWTFQGGSRFNAGAFVADRHALIGGWGKDFYSLNPDGSVNWRFTAADRITEDAIRFGNNIYFPSHDHFVYALEIPSGKLLWRFSANQPSNLVLQNQEITFSSGQDLITISAFSGQLLRKRSFGKMIDRIYGFPPNFLILSGDVYEVTPDFSRVSKLFHSGGQIFKLTTSEGMILASDDLYSIYGYEVPRPKGSGVHD
jgi:outer membrane protein assembly factor BamB